MNIKNLIHLLFEMVEMVESDTDEEVLVSSDKGTSFTIEDIRYDSAGVVYIDVVEKFKD